MNWCLNISSSGRVLRGCVLSSLLSYYFLHLRRQWQCSQLGLCGLVWRANAATRCDKRRRRLVLLGMNAPPALPWKPVHTLTHTKTIPAFIIILQFFALTVRTKDDELVQLFQFTFSSRVSSLAEARSSASPGDTLVPSLCYRSSSCLKFSRATSVQPSAHPAPSRTGCALGRTSTARGPKYV